MAAVEQTNADRSDEAGQAGYFVIADISGYTGFLTNNELAHAQGVLSEITELLIDKLSAPFRFVELEGDAVFVFAPGVAVEDSERLIDIMESCYAAFRLRLEQMMRNTSCECSACRTIPDLDLKCVAHYGRYVPQKTPTGVKLVGPDVILVHRLLKNSVIEKTGVHAYALLTDAFVEKAAFPELGLGSPVYEEDIPELGSVKGRVLDLAAAVDRYREASRRYIGPDDADITVTADFPAPRSLVWGYFLDAKRRLEWQTDTTNVENKPAPDGRAGVGWESHCDHGNYRMNHRVIDWQPFNYISMETTSTGSSLVKPPPSEVTFELQDLEGDQSRLLMRLRAKSRSPLVRLKLKLASGIVNKVWQGHFGVLKSLLRDDLARADAASEPVKA